MRFPLALAAAGAVLICAAPAGAAPSAAIRGAVARIVVIPEARRDIVVTVLKPNRAFRLRVTRFGSTVFIDGEMRHRVRGCRLRQGVPVVEVRGLGEIGYEAMPQVLIRMPPDARLTAADAVFGAVGRSQGLDFANQGCGVWTIGNVAGPAHVSQSGSGSVHLGAVGDGDFSVEGAGLLTVRTIRNGLAALSTGGGVIEAERVDGRFDARIAGAGRISAAAGSVTALTAQVAGSGRVNFGGEARRLNGQVVGAGVVSAARVTGPVVRRVFGSGLVSAGPPVAPKVGAADR